MDAFGAVRARMEAEAVRDGAARRVAAVEAERDQLRAEVERWREAVGREQRATAEVEGRLGEVQVRLAEVEAERDAAQRSVAEWEQASALLDLIHERRSHPDTVIIPMSAPVDRGIEAERQRLAQEVEALRQLLGKALPWLPPLAGELRTAIEATLRG